MAQLKSLFRDTAIYGLSSIIGRFLNYLLVPLYTMKISAESGGYGVITNVYAYVALLLVLLTFGMETTFFRFANKEGENARQVYATVMTMVGTVGLVFFCLVLCLLPWLSAWMGYADHPDYIWVMALVVALDAFQCIPFSWLRYRQRPIRFAVLKLLFIGLNIAANLFFFCVWPDITGHATPVGYVFYINLACTALITPILLLSAECKVQSAKLAGANGHDGASPNFAFCTLHSALSWPLAKQMLSYSWPILLLGIAGILNQTADKILFPYLYDAPDCKSQLGIYGAASKIAMVMAMITQAFRYAYEPFVFGKAKDKDSKQTYALGMKFFIIFTLLAFLGVVGYIDILRYIIGRDYWEGLQVVPIVMAAEIMMGVYFNLSFWYKLTDRTVWGAWFSGIGCLALVAVNVLFVPRYGYVACAWGGVVGYGTAMLLSYFVGQRYYPVAYPMKSIAVYVGLTVLAFALMNYGRQHLDLWCSLILNTFLLILFTAYIGWKEFLKKRHS